MKKRLTRIITRRGDQGTTTLADGTKLPKHARRIQAIGDLDELNSFIGLFLSEVPAQLELVPIFHRIQNDLFDLGGELAMPGRELIEEEHWRELEQLTERLNAELPPLENFILPGGSRAVALCHVVRSTARRAERSLVGLTDEAEVNLHARIYLNRLSDFCFVVSRWLAKTNGEAEILWQQRRPH